MVHFDIALMVHLNVHLLVQLKTPLRVYLKAHLKAYFEVYEDAKQGAFELHLKMCVVVRLLGHMSAQNDSIER